MSRRATPPWIALLLLLAPGCRTCPASADPVAERLGPATLRLAGAVEAAVAYQGLPPDAGEQEILAAATRDDATLLPPFAGHVLHVRRQGTHAVLLVCDGAGQRALLEDAGCTGPLDRDRASGGASPCEFTLDAAAVCAVRSEVP